RLQRFGRKHLPFYRIVVADARAPRDGRFIERIGTYNPLPSKDNVKELTADSERVRYWLSCGAQPSDRVTWLFGQIGLLPPPPVRVTTKHQLPRSLQKK
ncbi:30S ribosomal protein S16, partial [Ochromonadaceae sp. CCMP2298]